MMVMGLLWLLRERWAERADTRRPLQARHNEATRGLQEGVIFPENSENNRENFLCGPAQAGENVKFVFSFNTVT
jgi:hypothetical protein